ncbi:cytochrome c biogenesis heme-transporting ATPase CcmA [Legionella gresilensis]|uniref:cytochrome c biogenesis heme-transporting ATPase CcmA n=1 Tax=Legionella gresilensis TaxID=91823 RepID=UPI0010415396|nr:cytochrome c biogenesis heme-transporting ATPase CcmA [Legionella gresilensis]
MLDICSICFDYEEKPLLNEIQFSIESGTLLHLQGPNGVGKTTLLKILAGLLQPLHGDIHWQGQSIYNNLASYQRSLCYVGHKLGLSSQLTVRENCLFDLQWQHNTSSLPKFLRLLSLQDLMDKPCSQLSSGQLRRVALLRLLMTKAPLWLLDEPLIALDNTSIEILLGCFSKHLAQGGLIIMTSHQALPKNFKNCQEYQLC